MPHKDPDAKRAYMREWSRRQADKRRESAAAARLAAVEARPRWPDNDMSWAAGMFEGEGTMTIVYGGHSDKRVLYSRCIVTLTNTDREIIDFFVTHWPPANNYVYERKRQKEHHRPAWVWRIGGDTVLNFIADVRPFLKTSDEQRKFDIVEECQLLRRRGQRRPEHVSRILALHDEIALLNRPH
jgi:hypothetical protein